jgi:hypothetical protein
MNKKIGRNDPCPCGSGKKYKSCCAHKSPLARKIKHAVWIKPEPQKSAEQPSQEAFEDTTPSLIQRAFTPKSTSSEAPPKAFHASKELPAGEKAFEQVPKQEPEQDS